MQARRQHGSSSTPIMVAQHTNTPGEPPRPFSPEIEKALVNALRSLAEGDSDASSGKLRRAVAAAGEDARARDLRPEELVLAFKSIEAQLAKLLTPAASSAHEAVRTQVMQLLLEAYYADRRVDG